jgi:hypothetical protein
MSRVSVSDYRRLTRLYDALTRLKQEIAPEKAEDLDEYDRHRQKVHQQMTELKKSLNLMKKLTDPRDIVEHKMRLRDQFVRINDDTTAFGEMLTKYAKKRMKDKQLQAARVKAGQDWMKAIREELMKLAQASSEVDLSNTAIDTAGNMRDDRRDEQRRKRLEKRKNRRRKDGDDQEDWGNDLEMVQSGAGSEKEQAFLKKVELAREQEEEMLQMISQGLTELHQLATTLNKLLKQQQMLLDDVEDKMDRVQEKLDGNNKRLDNILEKTGGLVRFIPFLICGMFILAIAVFAYNRIK